MVGYRTKILRLRELSITVRSHLPGPRLRKPTSSRPWKIAYDVVKADRRVAARDPSVTEVEEALQASSESRQTLVRGLPIGSAKKRRGKSRSDGDGQGRLLGRVLLGLKKRPEDSSNL